MTMYMHVGLVVLIPPMILVYNALIPPIEINSGDVIRSEITLDDDYVYDATHLTILQIMLSVWETTRMII